MKWPDLVQAQSNIPFHSAAEAAVLNGCVAQDRNKLELTQSMHTVLPDRAAASMLKMAES